MKPSDLKNERDRKWAEREERRNRARTYKDKVTQPRAEKWNKEDHSVEVVRPIQKYWN